MPRAFASTSDVVTNSVGACSLTGAFFWAALIRRTSDTGFQWVASVLAGSGFKFGICLDTTSICSVVDGFSDQTGLTYAAADGYALIGSGKAAGTATPRFHSYILATNTFAHANGGGTQGNPSSGGDAVRFALNPTGGEGFVGDIAMVELLDRNLTDFEFEQLAFTLQAWYASNPVGGWILDQAATTDNIIDWTGNGANQSSLGGTTVSTVSVPAFSYGYETVELSASAAAGGTTHTADATLAVTATLSAGATADRPAAAALAVTATLTAAATREATATATLPITATLTAAATRTAVIAAILPITATLSAAADRTAIVTATLPITATLTADATVQGQVTASAALTVTATLTAGLSLSTSTAATLPIVATLTLSASTGDTAQPTRWSFDGGQAATVFDANTTLAGRHDQRATATGMLG